MTTPNPDQPVAPTPPAAPAPPAPAQAPARPRRSWGERFEWLETEAPVAKGGKEVEGLRAETARRCPRCGWLDSVAEAECFRCGHVFAAAQPEGEAPVDFTRALATTAHGERQRVTILDPSHLFAPGENDPPDELLIRRRSAQESLIPGFEKLLSLTHVNPELFKDYVHQRVVAEKALRELGGAALLADETGLGKTIEAGIIAAELIVRGLVRSVLVVVPASLSHQWREEMRDKFALDFKIIRTGEDLKGDEAPLKICSYTVIRNERVGKVLRETPVDLLICDEAHHLKNRSTKQYRAVNRIRKKYVLLLSATPFHNKLVELKSLIDVLKPGLLGSTRAFNKQYVDPKDARKPRNVHHLRNLLAEILIRNRRHEVSVKLPARRAVTYHLELGADERAFYDDLSEFIRNEVKERIVEAAAVRHDGKRYSYVLALVNLQRELTSSMPAVEKTLRRMVRKQEMAGPVAQKLEAFAERCAKITTWRKGDATLEVLERFPGQFVIFCEFLATIDKLVALFASKGIDAVPFHGGLGPDGKVAALQKFKAGARVLVASRAGGEGLNVQFCWNVLNFDLPWNPMAVEQRIGRVHRLGQTHPVTVVNLSVRDTIEARVLELLTYKLRLFTAVLGEIDLILGALHTEKSFEELLRDAWLKGLSEEELDEEFDKFGQALERARDEYEHVKESEQILDQVAPKPPVTGNGSAGNGGSAPS